MFKRLKVAAVNFLPWKWHKEWNADKLEVFFKEAGKMRCQARRGS